MNYVAGKVHDTMLNKLGSQDKFVEYMGFAHILRNFAAPDIMGVAELTQTPAVLINDKAMGEERNVTYNTHFFNTSVGPFITLSPLHVLINS